MGYRKFLLISGVLLLQIVLSITVATSVTFGMDYAKAPQGFQVWGIDLSGLDFEKSYHRLEKEIPRAVTYQGTVYPLAIAQSQQDLQDWLNQQLAPEGKSWWMNAFHYLKKMGSQSLSPPLINKQEVYPQLEKLAESIDQKGRPSSMQMKNGHFFLQPGLPSITLDVPASWEKLNGSRGPESVPLIVNSQEFAPSIAELSKVKDLLGDFTTYFSPMNEARTTNVRLAANALNGQLIEPGGVFSFNDVVGKRNKERGYLPAYTFVDQKVVLDDGGGICQDSSTLYQAVRQAHLEILERNSHSLPVTYVQKGQDATVAYGLLDFRFRNTTQGYLYIDARAGNDWLRMRIYGLADSEHPVLKEPDGYPMKPEDDMK